MPAVGERGAAEWIAERLGPQQGRRFAVDGERRPPLGIDGSPFLDRQALEDVVQVALDVGELVGLQHAREHIKPAAPVGLEDVGGDMAPASRGEENVPWLKKTAPVLTSFASAAWRTSRRQAA